MRHVLRASVLLIPLLSGCILGNRPQFVRGGSDLREVTFFLDGAGNLGFGKETVPLGLEDGGYQGQIEHYIWTTYLGPVMDQVSYSHNRREGRQLADRIRRHLNKYPGSKVNIIALSAGTGVAAFALESLPPQFQVDNVIMLSSSLSAEYNLGRALRRVRGGMYFFWSTGDPILRGMVPLMGTVDRENTSEVAGVIGARLPSGASRETRDLYVAHVHNIRWYTDEIGGPIKLRHAGTTDRTFIRDMVAPIIVGGPATAAPVVARSAGQPTATAAAHVAASPANPAVANEPSQLPASKPQPDVTRMP